MRFTTTSIFLRDHLFNSRFKLGPFLLQQIDHQNLTRNRKTHYAARKILLSLK